jgi:hypothetical protein
MQARGLLGPGHRLGQRLEQHADREHGLARRAGYREEGLALRAQEALAREGVRVGRFGLLPVPWTPT